MIEGNRMPRVRVQLICMVVISCCLFASSLHSAEYDYIDISNPFLKKIGWFSDGQHLYTVLILLKRYRRVG